jgi:hypothetical protein
MIVRKRFILSRGTILEGVEDLLYKKRVDPRQGLPFLRFSLYIGTKRMSREHVSRILLGWEFYRKHLGGLQYRVVGGRRIQTWKWHFVPPGCMRQVCGRPTLGGHI